MPAFISAALKWLVVLVIENFGERITAYIKGFLAFRAERKRIAEEAKKSIEPLQKATTGDEIEKASDDALSGF